MKLFPDRDRAAGHLVINDIGTSSAPPVSYANAVYNIAQAAVLPDVAIVDATLLVLSEKLDTSSRRYASPARPLTSHHVHPLQHRPLYSLVDCQTQSTLSDHVVQVIMRLGKLGIVGKL